MCKWDKLQGSQTQTGVHPVLRQSHIQDTNCRSLDTTGTKQLSFASEEEEVLKKKCYGCVGT